MVRRAANKAAAFCLLVASGIIAATSPASRDAGGGSHNLPTEDAARLNAHKIFNALDAAGRQWGSSIHHNGLSFFLATAPEGSLFYHGSRNASRVEGMEWLAFEVEHASNFARSWEPPSEDEDRGSGPGGMYGPSPWRHRFRDGAPPPTGWTTPDAQPPEQRPLGGGPGDDDGDDQDRPRRPRPPRGPRTAQRGYFQTYRAARPLSLLYIDGQAAGNSDMGTIDSQDFILLGYDPGDELDPYFGEFRRARELCDLATSEWGGAVDGFVRMEAGFEIIYCDFAPGGGLDLVSVSGTPFRNETIPGPGGGRGGPPRGEPASTLEWIRAVAARYDGQPRGRLQIDFSSMVSAFSYPANLSNPDPGRAELPRVVNASRAERGAIRSRVREVVAARGGGRGGGHGRAASVDWQAVADMISSRYQARLKYLADGDLSAADAAVVVNGLLKPYVDYTSDQPAGPAAQERCAAAYLDGPAIRGRGGWTPEDRAVYAALEAVAADICATLFEAWRALLGGLGGHRQQRRGDHADADVGRVRDLVRGLMARLDWAAWKRCGPCADEGQVCFTVMFPFGSDEDYAAPRCKNGTELLASTGYWSHGLNW